MQLLTALQATHLTIFSPNFRRFICVETRFKSSGNEPFITSERQNQKTSQKWNWNVGGTSVNSYLPRDNRRDKTFTQQPDSFWKTFGKQAENHAGSHTKTPVGHINTDTSRCGLGLLQRANKGEDLLYALFKYLILHFLSSFCTMRPSSTNLSSAHTSKPPCSAFTC